MVGKTRIRHYLILLTLKYDCTMGAKTMNVLEIFPAVWTQVCTFPIL